jgi:hypothetical protein
LLLLLLLLLGFRLGSHAALSHLQATVMRLTLLLLLLLLVLLCAWGKVSCLAAWQRHHINPHIHHNCAWLHPACPDQLRAAHCHDQYVRSAADVGKVRGLVCEGRTGRCGGKTGSSSSSSASQAQSEHTHQLGVHQQLTLL